MCKMALQAGVSDSTKNGHPDKVEKYRIAQKLENGILRPGIMQLQQVKGFQGHWYYVLGADLALCLDSKILELVSRKQC